MNTRFAYLVALAWSAPALAQAPTSPQEDHTPVVEPAQPTPTVEESPAPAPAPAPAPVATPAPAPAPAPAPVATPAPAPAPPAPRGETLTLELGSRTLFVRDDAYGIFSSRRALDVGGIALRAPVYRDDAWTYAAGVSLEGKDDFESNVRSAPVAFDLFRVVARGEVSCAAHRYVTAYGSVGLGAESLAFRYGDASESAWSKTWSPTGEVALGVGAHALLGWARLGVRLDGGYAVAKAHALRATLPEVGDVVRQPIDLGTLATSAPFVRFAFQLGF